MSRSDKEARHNVCMMIRVGVFSPLFLSADKTIKPSQPSFATIKV